MSKEWDRQVREVFAFSDKNSDGKLSFAEMKSAVRILSIAISEKQFAHSGTAQSLFDFAKFAKLVEGFQKLHQVTPSGYKQRELQSAFVQVAGKGGMSGSELRKLFGSVGEKLTEMEMDVVLKQAGDEKIDFTQLMKRCTV